MSYQDQGSTYLQTQIVSSSPEQLVPLMYQHLLVNLKKAGDRMDAGDMEGKSECLQRATAIVYELMASLDMEQGGEIAMRLGSLYTYFIRRISEFSRQMDKGVLDELLELVGSLHESWLDAARQIEGAANEATAP